MSFRRLRRRGGGALIRRVHDSVDEVQLSQNIVRNKNYAGFIKDYYDTLDHEGYNYIKFCYDPSDAHSFFTNSLSYFNNKTAIYMGLEIGDPCMYMIGVERADNPTFVYDCTCIYAPFTYNAPTGGDFQMLSTMIDNMIYTNFMDAGYFSTNYNYIFALKPITETDVNGWRWCDREITVGVDNTITLNSISKDIENDNLSSFSIQWGKLVLHPKECYCYFHRQREIDYLLMDSTGGFPVQCDTLGWETTVGVHTLGMVNYQEFE